MSSAAFALAKEESQVLQPISSVTVVGYDEIAFLAYELWQQRGCPDDSPETDWFAAEASLLSNNQSR